MVTRLAEHDSKERANHVIGRGPANVSPKRFSTLDGMRGVAAILVVVYHMGQRPGGLQFSGYLAVDLFFALSGFVIAFSYTKRFDSGLSVNRFFEMRFIRLFPLHAMGTILGVGKNLLLVGFNGNGAMGYGAIAAAFAFNLFMIPDFFAVGLFPLNGPSWSLFFEIAINVCFAAYLWRSPTWLVVSFMLISIAGLYFGISSPKFLSVGWSWDTFHLGIFRTTYSFLAGVLISRYVSFEVRQGGWLCYFPVVLMVIAIAYTAPVQVRAYAELAIVGICFPLLIIAGIRFEAPLYISKAFSFLGDLSYPMYAIHWPLIAIAYAIFKKLHMSPLLSAIVFIALLLPAAYAAAQIDQTIRKVLSRWAGLRRTAPLQTL